MKPALASKNPLGSLSPPVRGTGAGSLSGDGLHKGAPAIGKPNPVSRGFGCVPLRVLRCVEHIWAPAALIMISLYDILVK